MIRTSMAASAALAMVAAIAASPATASLVVYTAPLTGAAEAPPNASVGTGLVNVTFDTVLNTLRVQATFSGLSGNTTAAHIHCCTAVPFSGTAGVSTTTPSFVGFPLGVTSGSMDQTYDLTLASSFNAPFVTAQGGIDNARNALTTGMAGGNAYFNVHTSAFGGGEIRGFLASPVSEPSAWALLGLGLLGVAGFSRGQRRPA